MDNADNNFVQLEPLTWGTEDEQAFVRHLYHQKNLRALDNYRRLLPYRNFYGPGMYVDISLVRMTVESMIAALESDLLG